MFPVGFQFPAPVSHLQSVPWSSISNTSWSLLNPLVVFLYPGSFDWLILSCQFHGLFFWALDSQLNYLSVSASWLPASMTPFESLHQAMIDDILKVCFPTGSVFIYFFSFLEFSERLGETVDYHSFYFILLILRSLPETDFEQGYVLCMSVKHFISFMVTFRQLIRYLGSKSNS